MTNSLKANRSDKSQNRHQDHGFSLVELIIVLAIAMVLFALATPVVQNAVRNYTLNAASSNIARLTQLARYTAIRQGGISCTLFTGGLFGVDSNCDGAFANNDLQYAMPNGVTPSTTGPATTTMNFSAAPSPVTDTSLVIAFNARGNKIVAPADPTLETAVRIIFLTGWGNTSAVTVSGAGRTRSWRYVGATWR
ncbi:MAG: prepilin-type N-terminal cleavage/methylation domain-containing protein [Acidobacteria bacterium]|nr:prepilin-type N-terminal cleavage/methylation domain-containing protein [Acidobacteriota bacterium]